jgi:hypothetical protein
MPNKYDVIIVGSGPAGIFAALELSQASNLNILLLEKGKDLPQRLNDHSPCNVVSGWGGAGAFSDGKLTLCPNIGGRLREYLGLERTEELIHYIDSVYLKLGAPDKIYGGGPEVEEIRSKAELAGLRLFSMKIRHLGTECCRGGLQRLHQFLSSKVEVRTNTAATSILSQDGVIRGVTTQQGEVLECQYLILAPGREGADWLFREATKLGLTLHSNMVDIGVRVELPQEVLQQLTDVLYEPKLEFYSQTKQRVRTFCMCPAGEVITESTGGDNPVLTVNGHSYTQSKTNNTNFALLVSATFPEPFRDPISYGKSLARLANIISGSVIVQRFRDLQKGYCSTPTGIDRGHVKPTLSSAVPGDLATVIPYRFLEAIVEMLFALDKLASGVASPYTLLYGVEVKFYSSQLKLTPNLETEIKNAFAVGDGAGVSRGLVQASASGVVAAKEILKRLGKPSDVH